MQPFYAPDGPGRYLPSPTTAGPWSPHSQHGGPPAALLVRAVESLPEARDALVGRFTLDLLGPVPLGPLLVRTSVVRPGRSVRLVEAVLVEESRGRPCARANVWLFPDTGPDADSCPSPTPEPGPDGEPRALPADWHTGYLDAVEWRWLSGAVSEPGPGTVWMRPRVELVAGEPMSPVQRLMACVDSASGVSAALDPSGWTFVNTELSVHLLRRPVGEWLLLEAETALGPGRLGTATALVHDRAGPVARTAQALLVTRR
ncbi:MAG: thioesterase family protein [Nocardioidaceae bacterium]